MIRDAAELEPGTKIEADVVIVGAGPAGLTIARELEGLGLKIALLEAGGMSFEPQADDTSAPAQESRYVGGASGGAFNFDFKMFGNRPRAERQFGGNATAWGIWTAAGKNGIRLVPLQPADLEAKPWANREAWPIEYSDLEPYYERAKAVFGLPDKSFETSDWETPETPPLPIKGDRVKSQVFLFADGTVFTERDRKAIEASANVTLFLHAAALEVLVTSDGAHATGVRTASAPGREVVFSAPAVIVAAGGLGATQLLMCSDSVVASGLGGRHGRLGRGHMDHLLIDGGDFVPSSPDVFETGALYDLRSIDGVGVMGHLALTDQTLREEPIMNSCMMLFAVEDNYRKNRGLTDRQRKGFDASIRVREAVRQKRIPDVREVGDLIVGADGVVKRLIDRALRPKSHLSLGGWSDLPNRRRRFQRFEVVQMAEQGRHEDNRLYLSDERDGFGQRRLAFDWRWHPEDAAALARSQEIFARELAVSGLGRFEIARHNGEPVVITPSINHFMGSTRMSARPEDGVVDPNCRVWGVDNLYVAATSVFPTGGFANSTFTLIALAIRIADAVKARAKTAERRSLAVS